MPSRRLLEKIRRPGKAPSGSIGQQRNGSKLEKMNESEKALPYQICPCSVQWRPGARLRQQMFRWYTACPRQAQFQA